jgi:protein-tyrosine phosphatase
MSYLWGRDQELRSDGLRYLWEGAVVSDDVDVDRVSPSARPRTALMNLRQVGGPGFQAGRRRTVYRSDTRPVDPSVYPDGLTAVLDLRRDDEVAAVIHPLHAIEGYSRVPLFDPSSSIEAAADAVELHEQYIDWLQRHRVTIASAFRALAHTDGDVLVCCSAGKDRTGLVSALLARLWGADLERIGADYAITGENLADRFAAELAVSADPDRTMIAQRCLPEVMITVIRCVEEQYGGVREYLLSIGLIDAEIEDL